jgi:ComF family protein
VCEVTRPNYTALRAFGIFSGPLRSAIHQLKYERNLGLGNAFAIMLRDLFIDLHWPVNYVVPVPLSKARFKQRGYNQAAVIAYPFALLAGLQYSSKILKRTKDTRSQVGLSQRDRQVNVHDAFEAKTRDCYNLSFLVIDDVATTGSTLNACAAALLQAGANQIYCLTIARTDHPQFAVGLQEEQLELQSIT